MKRPFFSIIIPTYNSEETLGYTLESIYNQEFEKENYELLVIDGGSTDSTIEIAEKYGASIYSNSQKLPEHAKIIGVENAKGKFILRMDSDEEFTYKTQLRDKMKFLSDNPDIKVLVPNRYVKGRKELCGISASYMNILGDPFNYFIYNTKCDKYETYKKHIYRREGNNSLMRFKKEDILPLTDSGTTAFSLDYMIENYPLEYRNIDFICSTTDRIIADTGVCGCIKGDDIMHNCRSTLTIYLSKLRFRVINNIFKKEESGYSSKERHCPRLKQRKFLFCLYALIVPIPIIDSFRLAILHRDWTFLLHFFYLYYVCFVIVIMYMFHKCGIELHNDKYGK